MELVWDFAHYLGCIWRDNFIKIASGSNVSGSTMAGFVIFYSRLYVCSLSYTFVGAFFSNPFLFTILIDPIFMGIL